MKKILGRRRKNNWSSILPSFLVGAVIGAGVTLFASSRSGEEVRDFVREAGDEARYRARDVAREARERAEQLRRENEILDDTISKTHPL
jgi:gas vesicle protein